MTEKEYEWTGKIPVFKGRAYKTGEILWLTDVAAAEMRAKDAIKPKGKTSSKSVEPPAEKPEGVKSDGR